MRVKFSTLLLGFVLFGGAIVASCSSSSGGGPAGLSGFQLRTVSLKENAIWEINRRIEFTFNEPVDFLSVSSNTINIVTATGAPATGQFFFKRLDTDGDGVLDTTDENTVVFQPNCPTQADFSDAGLSPGGVSYMITVVGLSSQTNNTIRSKTRQALEETQQLPFTTPASADPGTIFLDTFPSGPPEPIVRAKSSTTVTDGITYVEIGNNTSDPQSRIFFDFDTDEFLPSGLPNPNYQQYGYTPGTNAPNELPLNLYADFQTATAVLVEFNQAVNPSETNISSSRLRLEIQDASLTWLPIDTRVELVSNCTRAGATVRLEPIGVLPTGSQFRVVVLPGFQDLVGQTRLLSREDFAIAPTDMLSYASLDPAKPNDGADEFKEEFIFGGDSLNSFQDEDALFDTPEASWKAGKLTAAFDFDADPQYPDFDWIIRTGETFLFDTTSNSIVGGPNGVPTAIQDTTNGVVSVRNLHVEAGGTLRVQGPNTMLINATGEVRIDGTVDVSGFTAKDVATLNTGAQPEAGGAGAGGGGRGGNASEVINNSTPRGGSGSGPFLEAGTGGLGGESAFAPDSLGKDARRPGGGGGGRFAKDFNQNVGGLHAGAGKNGHKDSRGAVTGASPAKGGSIGRGPFLDGDGSNDFFGTKPLTTPDGSGGFLLTGLVRGELNQVWAGYGGGGGGDALPSNKFPTRNWGPGSDEKGGGGGGGGGGIRIRALDQIIFGFVGKIVALGGQGGTGENTLFLDHVGGTGGSGTGGHVMLESAVRIDFSNGSPGSNAGNKIHVNVTGASGKIGPKDNGNGEQVPQGISHGGSGGPGQIQLHVPRALLPPTNDPLTSDIVLPTASLNAGNPLNQVARPSPVNNSGGTQLIPTFGARSKVRSKWISIGGADLDPDPMVGNRLMEFLFDGVDTTPGLDQGKVLTTGETVDQLGELLGPEVIPPPTSLPPPTVVVGPDGLTLFISGASLDPLINSVKPISEDIYLRTPALLRNFVLVIDDVFNANNNTSFNILDASYDDAATRLMLRVDGSVTTIAAAIAGISGVPQYRIIPLFFRVRTEKPVVGFVTDYLPDSAFVKFTFDAAGDDGFGNPDEDNLLVSQTGDISDFNALTPGDLKFFRFEVEFNLDAGGNGVSTDTKPVEIDFLKIPFRFSVPGP